MAQDFCVRTVTERKFEQTGYKQVLGRTIIIWPPEQCIDTPEKRKSTYRRLKSEFGLCVLHIPMASGMYADALDAGWDNNEIRIALGPRYMENLKLPDNRPTWWPSDLGWEGGKTIMELLESGIIDFSRAVEISFDLLLEYWGNIYKEKQGGHQPTPFYSFYVDEPQTGSYADIRGGLPSFTKKELSIIYNYIKNRREAGDPRFSMADGFKTLFTLSAFFPDDPFSPEKFVREYSELADMTLFSAYVNWFWDPIFGDPKWDQRSEWDDFTKIVPDGSGYISLQLDFGNREFGGLLRQATSLRWDTIGLFGGNDAMTCDAFWRALKQFSEDAVMAKWMERVGAYTFPQKTQWCHKPNCDCAENEWSNYPPYHNPDDPSEAGIIEPVFVGFGDMSRL